MSVRQAIGHCLGRRGKGMKILELATPEDNCCRQWFIQNQGESLFFEEGKIFWMRISWALWDSGSRSGSGSQTLITGRWSKMWEVGCTKSPASRQGPHLRREQLVLPQALVKKEIPSAFTYTRNYVCSAGQEPRTRGYLSHETSLWPGQGPESAGSSLQQENFPGQTRQGQTLLRTHEIAELRRDCRRLEIRTTTSSGGIGTWEVSHKR